MSAEDTQTQTPDQSTQSTDQSQQTTSSDSQDTQQNQGQTSNDDAGAAATADASASTTDTAAADAPAEEEYEIELAEDSPLSEEDLNEIVEEATRLKLNKEDATKLIQAREKSYKAGLTKAQAEYQSRIDNSRKEIMADPMFSKENAPTTFASMARAVETFGDEDMVNLVKSAEFGNNVVLARFLKRLGDALAPDDKSMTGGKGSSGAAKADGNDTLRNLYPDFYKEEK